MKRENNHGEGGHVCPSFFQRKHNREWYAAEEVKEKDTDGIKAEGVYGNGNGNFFSIR